MTSLVKKALAGTVMGATLMTVAAPAADAQRHRNYRHNDNTGAAIVAGVAGLAIGAALASGDRRYDYDRGYYRQHGYYPTDGYYYRENYRRHRGYERCSIRRVYDPYLHRRVAVRYCR